MKKDLFVNDMQPEWNFIQTISFSYTFFSTYNKSIAYGDGRFIYAPSVRRPSENPTKVSFDYYYNTHDWFVKSHDDNHYSPFFYNRYFRHIFRLHRRVCALFVRECASMKVTEHNPEFLNGLIYCYFVYLFLFSSAHGITMNRGLKMMLVNSFQIAFKTIQLHHWNAIVNWIGSLWVERKYQTNFNRYTNTNTNIKRVREIDEAKCYVAIWLWSECASIWLMRSSTIYSAMSACAANIF